MRRRHNTGPDQEQLASLIALYNQGRLQEVLTQGLALARQYPNAPFIPNLLGVVYNTMGRKEESLASYDRAVSLKPDYIDAWFNRGNVLQGLMRLEAAIASYDKAIALNPDYAEACMNRGNALQNLGQLDAALASYDKAIAIRPDYIEALASRGNVLNKLNQPEAAVAAFDQVIKLRPDFAEAWFNRGKVLSESRLLEVAVASYDKAIACKPEFPEAWYNRGDVLQELKRLDDALASYDKAIALKPDYADAYTNRGNALQRLGRLDEALSSYDRSIALKPDFAEAYSSRGNTLQALKRLDEALASYDRAITLNPDYADAWWNKSLALLLSGDFSRGWKLYEWRWKTQDFQHYLRNCRQPLWTGDGTLAQKNIVLHSEQGVGDEIMFASCIPDLLEQVASCVLLCDPRLVPLFSRSFPTLTVIGLDREREQLMSELSAHATDLEVAIGSLPGYYRSTLADFPVRKNYLVPDEQRHRFWLERLGSLGKGLKIGISWRGGRKDIVRSRRSTRLEQWRDLCTIQGTCFINLQYGDCQAELLEAREQYGLEIQNWADVDPLKDLDDFAALVSALDLVISVDNSTVHMAGALGTPAWVLLPCIADWRWLLERNDSPWYPGLRLYRQQTAVDWDGVFSNVEADLLKLTLKGSVTNEI